VTVNCCVSPDDHSLVDELMRQGSPHSRGKPSSIRSARSSTRAHPASRARSRSTRAPFKGPGRRTCTWSAATGSTTMVSEERIAELLGSGATACATTGEALIAEANRAGGRDNNHHRRAVAPGGRRRPRADGEAAADEPTVTRPWPAGRRPPPPRAGAAGPQGADGTLAAGAPWQFRGPGRAGGPIPTRRAAAGPAARDRRRGQPGPAPAVPGSDAVGRDDRRAGRASR